MKRFTYRNLLFAFFGLLPIISLAQNPRQKFEEKFWEGMGLVKTDLEKAQELTLEAWDIAKTSQDTWGMAMAKSGMGYIGIKKRDYAASYVNYSDAERLFEECDSLDLYNKLDVTHQLAIIHSKYKNYDQSIEKYNEAYDLAKEYFASYPEHMREKNRLRYLVNLPYFTAVQYEAKGAHQTAGKILIDLWEQAEDKEDIVTHARVLNKLGLIKKNNGEYDDAIEYFGLVASEPTVSEKRRALAYQNLGETYLKQGELERSERYLLLARDMKKELNNPRSMFITYLYLGELEYQRNKMGDAINMWETGLEIFDDVQGEPELYEVYNKLQLAYMDIDIAKAKSFNKEFSKLNDFYVRNQTFQREEEAQRREALSMLIDKEKQRRVDAQQREEFIRQFWPVFLGVGLLVLFSVILGVRYYMALRANRALSQTQLKLERAKEILKSADTDLD